VSALAAGAVALRHRASVLAYLGGWRLVRVLPERPAYWLFEVLADLAWSLRGKGVRRLEANLRRVRPDADHAALRSLSREGMRSYLRYWCDAFRLPTWSPDRVAGTCRPVGDGPVRAALASGRGVVMALSHQGNWDHAGAWSALRLARVTTVAERLEPTEVFEAFLAFRERLGMEILPLTGGSDVFRTLARRLRDGGFVPLVADRDLTSTGVEVSFFGEPARMAAGPAALAEMTGAALVPVSIHYEADRLSPSGWGIVVDFAPEVEVPELPGRAQRVAAMTQACADALGAGIAAHPQDWHMLQRVFVADLAPRPEPAEASG
jgi:KDO2-lipid IV(A) lauroyltransferase